MSTRKFHLHDGRQGAALAVKVTLGAPQNKITEILPDGTLKIRLNSEEGNQELLKFLSEVLEVSISKIDIIGGFSGNDKLISILDVGKDDVQKRIMANIR